MTDDQVREFLKHSNYLREDQPPRINWRLIIGLVVVLNVLAALTIGGAV